jgi:NAD kinase
MAGRQVIVGDEVVMATPKGSGAYSEAAVCGAIGG